MLVLPNLIHRFNAILIKIPASYLTGSKVLWRDKQLRIFNTLLEEKKLENWHCLALRLIIIKKPLPCKRQCQEKKKISHGQGQGGWGGCGIYIYKRHADKGPFIKIYEELLKHNSEKTIWFKNGLRRKRRRRKKERMQKVL